MNLYEKNYKTILKNEERIARKVTSEIIEKPQISPWMILIPILFVPYLQRYEKYKHLVDSFSQGYLFTKKLALETAMSMVRDGISKDQAHANVVTSIQHESHAKKHISEIYQKQIKETELLVEHFYQLLQGEGEKIALLIKNVYPEEANYRTFLKSLKEAETAVNKASILAINADKSDKEELPKIITNMEKALNDLRTEELQIIYF